jgi:hypothetical protein
MALTTFVFDLRANAERIPDNPYGLLVTVFDGKSAEVAFKSDASGMWTAPVYPMRTEHVSELQGAPPSISTILASLVEGLITIADAEALLKGN